MLRRSIRSMHEHEEHEDDEKAYIDGLTYQGQVTENIDGCIAVALHLLEAECPSNQVKRVLEEALESTNDLREVQTNLGFDLCDSVKISRDRFNGALAGISDYAGENFDRLKEDYLSNAGRICNTKNEEKADELHRELARVESENESLREKFQVSRKEFDLVSHKYNDLSEKYHALQLKHISLDEQCRSLQEKAASKLAARRNAAGKSAAKRRTLQSSTQLIPDDSMLTTIWSKRANAFCLRIANKSIGSDENRIVAGNAPFIPGAVKTFIENVQKSVPLRHTFSKLCEVLSSKQTFAVIVSEHDSKMVRARMIDFCSTYDTITKQADKSETERANSIAVGAGKSTMEALYEELTEVLVATVPALKKLQDDGLIEDLREEVETRIRGFLKYRKEIDVLLSNLSKCSAADHLIRRVSLRQVLSFDDVLVAWSLHSTFSETPMALDVFPDISVSDYRAILNKALRSDDLAIKEKALRLTLNLSTGLREKKNGEVLPEWANAQNACPQTGEIATPAENSGLFVDNDATHAKGNTQTSRQCMAVRSIMLQMLASHIELILEANNIDMKLLESASELLLYLPSDDLCGGAIGLFEKSKTYEGLTDGTGNPTLAAKDIGKIEKLITKASKNKRILGEFTGIANLTGSQEHRQSTAQVYVDLLQHFRTGDGEEE